MKNIIFILSLLIVLGATGCSVKKTTLRADNKFFVPIKKLPSDKSVTPKIGMHAAYSLEKELAQKTTENELLKKQVQALKAKILKLEKQIGVTKTNGAPMPAAPPRDI